MAAMPTRTVVVQGPVGSTLYRGARRLVRGFARAYFRLEIVGSERVPDTGAFIAAPVHRSIMDSPLVGVVLPRRVRFMAKSGAFVGGAADKALNWLGAFPVDREGTDFGAIATLEELLGDGEAVVVFPEGTRKEGTEVVDLRDGPAFVAARQRIPIVPIGIGGTHKAMPIGAKFPRPRKVVVIIGEPIYPDVELEGRVPRSAIRELTEELRTEIDRLYTEASRRAS